MTFSLFHRVPIWLDFLIFAGVIFASLEIGFRIGLLRRGEDDNPSQSSQFILTPLFGVVGLMLAFTFGAGLAQHKARKRAVVAEANVLETAYLRAGLVEDVLGRELREALLDYARTRRGRPGQTISLADLKAMVAASEAAKGRLWPITEQIVRGSPAGPIEAILAESVNAVLDSGTLRLAAVSDTLPTVVLITLLVMVAVTVSVSGYNAGASAQMSRWRYSLLSLILAAILLVIIDFDRPNIGFIKISQQAIESVIADMEAGMRP